MTIFLFRREDRSREDKYIEEKAELVVIEPQDKKHLEPPEADGVSSRALKGSMSLGTLISIVFPPEIERTHFFFLKPLSLS